MPMCKKSTFRHNIIINMFAELMIVLYYMTREQHDSTHDATARSKCFARRPDDLYDLLPLHPVQHYSS